MWHRLNRVPNAQCRWRWEDGKGANAEAGVVGGGMQTHLDEGHEILGASQGVVGHQPEASHDVWAVCLRVSIGYGVFLSSQLQMSAMHASGHNLG